MRMLTGVAIEGRVVEMALPSDIPVAHLMPDVLAALEAGAADLKPRRIDGTWLDLERSLDEQGCTPGGVMCLEPPERGPQARRDPLSDLAESAPPLVLIPDGVIPATVGAASTAVLVASSRWTAPVAVALAPCMWALLPLLGGAPVGDREGLRRVLRTVELVAGSGALAASGCVAALGWSGVALDGSVVATALVHVARRHAAGPLPRVLLGTIEWLSLVAVLPLMCIAAGWSHR